MRAGTVAVRIKVQRPATGKVKLQGRNKDLAKGRATLDPQHQKVRLRLTKAGRRLIRPGGIRAARLVATLHDDAGAYFRVTARVRVRR